jgi:uncharacterized protein (TIGR00251 family)
MKSNEAAERLNLTESPNGVLFKVHVQPRASKNEICGIRGDELKLRLTAAPVDDAANKLCIVFFADRLGVARSRISITSGTKSRHKTIRVDGIDADTLLNLLDIPSAE